MAEKVKKIAVTGFYGQNNFGDDLFEYIFSSILSKKGAEVAFYGGGPLKGKAANLCKFVGKNLYGRHFMIDKMLRVLTMLRMVMASDLIIYGGGSVFGKYASLKQRKLVSFIATILGKELWAISISVGPFSDDIQRKSYLKVLNRFEQVVVRDLPSYSALKEVSERGMSLKLLPDIAFFTRDYNGQKEQDTTVANVGRILVIAIHLDEFIDPVIEYLRVHAADFDKLCFMSLQTSSNEVVLGLINKISAKLKDKSEYIIYNGPDNLSEVCSKLEVSSYVITSKLHGAIVSASFGVPFHIFPYQEKCSDFVDMLGYKIFNDKLLGADETVEAKAFLEKSHSKLKIEDYGIN